MSAAPTSRVSAAKWMDAADGMSAAKWMDEADGMSAANQTLNYDFFFNSAFVCQDCFILTSTKILSYNSFCALVLKPLLDLTVFLQKIVLTIL